MHQHEFLAAQFEANRRHLRAVAFRMLGSLSEAEDAVQEAWLRLGRADTSEIGNFGGWLTTVVARVCLDALRARKSRREEPLDEHVPEPVVARGNGADPEQEMLMATRSVSRCSWRGSSQAPRAGACKEGPRSAMPMSPPRERSAMRSRPPHAAATWRAFSRCS